MIYNNVPTQEIKQAHGSILFNTQTTQWECAKCERKATVHNKRNLLQHAIIKHKPQRQLEIKVRKPATEEQEQIERRIRTLKIHNIQEETQTPQQRQTEQLNP